jgi:Holliday junction resolvasome RuvABC ATP-dependent DNA helicase subunit
MARKRGYRGVIGKAALRGNINKGLEDAATRWVTGVSQAVNYYKTGLKEYLMWYVPRIEQAYQAALSKDNTGTIDSRVQIATQIMKETSRLAAEYRKLKNEKFIKQKIAAYGGNVVDGVNVTGLDIGGSNPLSYMSNETPKKQAIKNVITL